VSKLDSSISQKTDASADVMPLIYHSLESETPSVQERTLKAIPSLCEGLPYDVLEQVLLVKVAVSYAGHLRIDRST
jgi:hypothetical protein